MRYSFSVWLVAITSLVYGQKLQTQYSITGNIQSLASGQVMPFVAVALYTVDSTLVTGSISDEEGNFSIQAIPQGGSYLEISAVGYEKYFVEVQPWEDGKHLDMGVINLHEQTIQLDELVVTSQRASVEYKADRKVVNIRDIGVPENSTLPEALQILPSVYADENGNMSLRGSANFIVLIDGQPTQLSGSDALRQYTVGQVEKVEIITNPSARYNADNTSGIINIILRKDIDFGVSSSINIGTSIGENSYQPVSLNTTTTYRKKRISITGTFNFNNPQYDFIFSMQQRRMDDGDLDIFTTNNVRWNRWRAAVDVDYQFSDKNTLSISGRKMNDDYTFDMQNLNRAIQFEDSSFRTRVKGPIDRNGLAFTVQDKFKFEGEGHELSLLSAYFNEKVDESQMFSEFTDENITYRKRYSGNHHNLDQARLEADYSKPFHRQGMLESGINIIISSRDVDRFVNELIPQPIEVKNSFKFTSETYAAYLTWSDSLFGVFLQGGLRTEYFNRRIVQDNPDTLYLFNQLSLFPSFSLTRKFTNRQLQFSFSRRIRRPSVDELRPYYDWSDNVRSYGGNPGLVPATINSFEASYHHYFNTITASAEVYYRNTQNEIVEVSKLNTDNGIIEQFPDNVGRSSFYGFESSAEIQAASWLKITVAGTFFQNAFKGKFLANEIDRQYNGWRIRMGQTYVLPKDIRININGYYNSRVLTPQGREAEQYWLDLSMNTSFMKKRGTLSLSLTDALNTRVYYRMAEGEGFSSSLKLDLPSPVFTINMGFKINDFKTRENRFDFEY